MPRQSIFNGAAPRPALTEPLPGSHSQSAARAGRRAAEGAGAASGDTHGWAPDLRQKEEIKRSPCVYHLFLNKTVRAGQDGRTETLSWIIRTWRLPPTHYLGCAWTMSALWHKYTKLSNPRIILSHLASKVCGSERRAYGRLSAVIPPPARQLCL